VLLSGANADGDNSVVRDILAEEEGPEINENYGLTSLFGYRIPSRLGDASEDLNSVEETEALRNQGYLTPSAPPKPASERGFGVSFSN
jgi:hypothetical protein